MFFRQLCARGARPSWRVVARGKKDLPIWRYPDSYRRPSHLNDHWFPDFFGPFRHGNIDDFFRENMRRMDAMFRMSPWRILEESAHRTHGTSAEVVEAKFGKDGLHLEINLSHFQPDDVAVRISGDRLVISGKHSSKQDEHGFVAREFTREFLIPEDIDTETLSCRLTDEGHLVVSAKVKGEPETSRTIPIERDSSNKKESDKSSESD
ncbi:alpha-crystallin A chain-like [Babylonia areolata]|uniref:alpha-crystallin A chain-like n=1 Tax=Babylonia areolata TaxID=304850 RepID=UPI003FD3A896